jgi:4-amino-4-deoxy-L-arabinose transferase-like glycosyltransferase
VSVRSERAVAIAFASIRTAVCAYRAATQSFVSDEAFTFNNFIAGSWRDLYFQYDANNHLLYSILSKLSMSVFGSSEFALRLPSVIAGFFLMLGVWRILENVDSWAIRWVAFIAIGLHPLMFDFSAAARGYSLAMALVVWALLAGITQRYKTAGILAGLAIGANFSAVIPALGFLTACLVLGEGPFTRRLRRTVGMGLLAAAPVLIVCAGTFPLMHGYFFYAGIPALSDSLHNLVYGSIFASSRIGLFGTWAAAGILTFGVLPAIVLFIALASLFAWRKGKRRELIPAATLGAAALGMIAAHYLIGMNYPIDRTGLIAMVLFGIAWAIASGGSNRVFRGVNLVLGLLLAIQFATQFHTSYFQIWPYDRSIKTIAREVEEESRNKPPGSVSIGASWIHQSALEYYRVHDRAAVLKPVRRLEVTLITGQDFYVLNEQDKDFDSVHKRAILFWDPFAGVALAK